MLLPVTKIISNWNSVSPRHLCLLLQVTTPSSQLSVLEISNLSVLKIQHCPYQKAPPPSGQGWKPLAAPTFLWEPLCSPSHTGALSSSNSNPKPRQQITASRSGFVYLIRRMANRVLLFSLPVKYTTCILQFPKVLACSVWPPLINTQRSKEVSGRGLHTNLVPLEETEYLLHSCVIWQALHPDQGSRLGQDGSVGGSGSSCHSSWGSCNVPHRGRRYWRAERERERKKNCYKKQ